MTSHDVPALRRCGLGLMMTLIADHVAEMLSQRAGWGGGGGHSLCGAAPQASLDAEAGLLQQVVVADGAEAPGAPGVHAGHALRVHASRNRAGACRSPVSGNCAAVCADHSTLTLTAPCAEAAKAGALQAAAASPGGNGTIAAPHAHAYAAVNGNGAGAGDSPRSTSSRLSFEVEDAGARASPGMNPTPNPAHPTPLPALPAVLLLRDSLGGGASGGASRSPSTPSIAAASLGGAFRAAGSGAAGVAAGAHGAGAGDEDAAAAVRDKPPAGKGRRGKPGVSKGSPGAGKEICAEGRYPVHVCLHQMPCQGKGACLLHALFTERPLYFRSQAAFKLASQ